MPQAVRSEFRCPCGEIPSAHYIRLLEIRVGEALPCPNPSCCLQHRYVSPGNIRTEIAI